MTEETQAEAHRFFSARCFNSAWEHIAKDTRTPENEIEMLLRSAASMWHWTQRPDCTDRHRSIGYWQLSRVFALMDEPALAQRFAEICLEASTSDGSAFYVAYAYEALARASAVAGNQPEASLYLTRARVLADGVEDEDERKGLIADMETVLNRV